MRCRFCESDVISKNFLRHLERHHGNEKEVKDVLQFPKCSKERRQALALLRNDTNFDLYIGGTVRPNRSVLQECATNQKYFPCAYCKGLFLEGYLKRHAKLCTSQKTDHISNKTLRINHLSNSQTAIACASDPTDTISKLNVKNQVRLIIIILGFHVIKCWLSQFFYSTFCILMVNIT